MGLTETFQNAAETAFNAFGDIVKAGVYTEVNDDGFDTAPVTYDCRVVGINDLEQKVNVTFEKVIQPNDVIALVLGKGLTVEIQNNNKLTFAPDALNSETFTIIDKNIDAARALYILLLRKL